MVKEATIRLDLFSRSFRTLNPHLILTTCVSVQIASTLFTFDNQFIFKDSPSEKKISEYFVESEQKMKILFLLCLAIVSLRDASAQEGWTSLPVVMFS